MYDIHDVTDWPRIGVEQMGTKRKFWCRHPQGHLCLFKFSRPHAGEDWSEKIAAEVATVLGIPHAEIELAICSGSRGTISRDFTNENTYGSLIHGNELLQEHDPNYPQQGRNFRVAQHTLTRIFAVLNQPFIGLPDSFAAPPGVVSACALFVGYLLLDALITNTDRHHENWAILVRRGADGSRWAELAPTYDHASSMGRELTDERRSNKVKAEERRSDPRRPSRRDQTIIGYLEKDEGRSRIFALENEPKPLHLMDVFRLAREHFPDAGEAWLDQLDSVRMQIFEQIVANVPLQSMTQSARDFCLRLLNLNRKALVSRTFQYD